MSESKAQSTSTEARGKEKASDEAISSQSGPSADRLFEFLDTVEAMQDVPVMIGFTHGETQERINLGIVQSTVECTETLRDLFESINDSDIAKMFRNTYDMEFPYNAIEVEAQLSDDDRVLYAIYNNIPAQMNSRTWAEPFLTVGLQPSWDLYNIGHVPRIEVTVGNPEARKVEKPSASSTDSKTLVESQSTK